MLARARELNQSFRNCQFILNTENHLEIFTDNTFDMVYTNKVLQHISSRKMIRDYLAEFLRVLKRGGLLVFQLLSYIPVRNRIQPRRRMYSWLRALGVREADTLRKNRTPSALCQLYFAGGSDFLYESAGWKNLACPTRSESDACYSKPALLCDEVSFGEFFIWSGGSSRAFPS